MHLFVGDKEIALEKNQAEFDAPAGKHTLTIVWDHTVRTTDFLQADIFEPATNAAHAPASGRPVSFSAHRDKLRRGSALAPNRCFGDALVP